MNDEKKIAKLSEIARLIRYYTLISTSNAGSGHPTSAMSATDLMTGLFFGGAFRYDLSRPDHPNNDRIIFSKGHASPLFYSLWAAAGQLTEKHMLSYRQFGSTLEGHPTPAFKYADAATGSLGQGLSIGVGMALNGKYLDKLSYRTYVLLGDSEMSEGSQWEAIQIAGYYKLDNLVGILDVNRLGQRGETMYGRDLNAYERRVRAFGWNAVTIDGHSFDEILAAYEKAAQMTGAPTMIIAGTVKGKGFSKVEDKNGFHGKALGEEDLRKALRELGEVDKNVRGEIGKPEDRLPPALHAGQAGKIEYAEEDSIPTRKAYGSALNRIYPEFPDMVIMDGEVSNSTYAEKFKDVHPDRFFEMFIAEQNMAGVALGLSCRGKIPFVSTFSAFWTRAFDQARMSRYSDANIKFVGSHAGVSIGEDGPSQMGLEDLAMFRTVLDGTVLYPCDAVSTEHLVGEAARHRGIVYIRTTRAATPVLYRSDEQFPIGGCKVLRQSGRDRVTVVSAGITLHEALKAYEELKNRGIPIRIIDLYSIKPVDGETLRRAGRQTEAMVTVEDHYAEGGLGDAVREAVTADGVVVHSLAVRKKPRSGKSQELLDFEEIGKSAIVEKVRRILQDIPAQ